MRRKFKMYKMLFFMKWKLFCTKIRLCGTPFVQLEFDERLLNYCDRVLEDATYTFTNYTEKMCYDKFEALCKRLNTQDRKTVALFYNMLYLADT